MIFETHAHYDDESFDEDRDVLLARLPQENIETVINVGATFAGAKASLELAHQYPYIYAAVGVHPSEIADLSEGTLEELQQMARDRKTVAIGEIGLDYYWDKEADVQEAQRMWFRRQLELARQVQLPVIIHSRDAAEDTFSMMKEAAGWGMEGVIHCYSYSAEMAREYVKLGYYIGVGGVVTFKNARKLKETVDQIPLEQILLETDSPYMTPEPFRGMRNDSTYIPYVIETIAKIKGITQDEVMVTTRENARRLFSRVK
ncbi:MAG: TatD family hydrolase [Lachnospiraceae bacterium]|nr:TatD family hydrolase [Lachnospiraceae bacterium]